MTDNAKVDHVMKKTDAQMKIQRLYDAAKLLVGIQGKSALARHLGISPQTLANWEDRGISKAGLILCQQKIGVSIEWLDTADGEMRNNDQPITPVTPVWTGTSDAWPFERISAGWIAKLTKTELSDLEFVLIDWLMKLERTKSNH
jgi:DNA-binding XRE family transcriptional regulator